LYLFDSIILRIWKTLPFRVFSDKLHILADRAPVLDGGISLKPLL